MELFIYKNPFFLLLKRNFPYNNKINLKKIKTSKKYIEIFQAINIKNLYKFFIKSCKLFDLLFQWKNVLLRIAKLKNLFFNAAYLKLLKILLRFLQN